jgi:hypothetical protein
MSQPETVTEWAAEIISPITGITEIKPIDDPYGAQQELDMRDARDMPRLRVRLLTREVTATPWTEGYPVRPARPVEA